MDKLERRPTKSTPYVLLDNKTGTCVIAGRSIPIDAELFYKPILTWLDEFTNESPSRIDFTFRYDFFNIASSKRVLFVLYKLSELQKKGFSIIVRWMSERYDEDMFEIGKDYALMADDLVFSFEHYDNTELNESKMLKFG